ncbi:hypothetical protein BC833DRAFT_600025 [Globomyces pollinis-pini]|nr:hypothetical protein BC833DRAFT_600025 [Globomyces pollinis-pini]KAJ2994602.1 hypothetical protein HDV02_001461 [Globomyces sp. JEL0801]
MDLSRLPFEVLQMLTSHLSQKDYQLLRQSSRLIVLPIVQQPTWEAYTQSCEDIRYYFRSDTILMKMPLLMTPKVEFITNDRLLTLMTHHQFQLVYKILLKSIKNLDLTTKQSLFTFVARVGHIAITDLLLADTTIDLSFSENILLLESCKFGNNYLSRKLLEYSEIDPSINHNNIIQKASLNDQTEAVKTLLMHPRVNPNELESEFFESLVYVGASECLNVLLNDSRINPNMNSGILLRLSARLGQLNCVNKLLNNSRINPNLMIGFNNLSAFGIAIEHDEIECVKLFLACDRVNLNLGKSPLMIAVSRGYAECLKILLDSPGIDVEKYGTKVVAAAQKKSQQNVLQVLFDHPRTQGLFKLEHDPMR